MPKPFEVLGIIHGVSVLVEKFLKRLPFIIRLFNMNISKLEALLFQSDCYLAAGRVFIMKIFAVFLCEGLRNRFLPLEDCIITCVSVYSTMHCNMPRLSLLIMCPDGMEEQKYYV